MRELRIDTSHVKNIEELHTRIAKKLGFPNHYGKNLDALYDCLSGEVDLPLKLIWENYSLTHSKLGKPVAEILKVMKDFSKEDPEFNVEIA